MLLAFENQQGTIHFEQANDILSAGKTIDSHAKAGYTLNAIHGTQTIDTFYIVQTDNHTFFTVAPASDSEEAINAWFTKLAKTIAFDDCSNDYVFLIFYQGQRIKYAGWQPGMLIAFEGDAGKTIWSNSFPEWDH